MWHVIDELVFIVANTINNVPSEQSHSGPRYLVINKVIRWVFGIYRRTHTEMRKFTHIHLFTERLIKLQYMTFKQSFIILLHKKHLMKHCQQKH